VRLRKTSGNSSIQVPTGKIRGGNIGKTKKKKRKTAGTGKFNRVLHHTKRGRDNPLAQKIGDTKNVTN